MSIIDLLKWDAGDNVYAWKYPSDQLSTWTQLIVHESQEAILLKEGKMIGPFGPGRHTLDTKNIPLLSSLFAIPFGGRSPFTAEVWYVNKSMPLDVKWGTTTPIQILDPKYKVMLPVRGFGQYGVQISDSRKFLAKLVGTMPSFSREKLVSYFRGIMIQEIKTSIAKMLVKDRISILEISAHVSSLSNAISDEMAVELEEFGVKLIKFKIDSVNTPDDDPAVTRLRDALAKKAEMDIIGFSYQQERSFDTLETAAGNEGSSNATLMGAGIGLGMGVGIGGAIGGVMGQLTQNLGGMAGVPQNQAEKICKKCSNHLPGNVRFCGHCGYDANASGGMQVAEQDKNPCDKCGANISKGARFCPNCGDTVFACPKCGQDNAESSTNCSLCGSALPIVCSKCSTVADGNSKFCAECGNSLRAIQQCIKCGEELKPGAKFCSKCGTSQ